MPLGGAVLVRAQQYRIADDFRNCLLRSFMRQPGVAVDPRGAGGHAEGRPLRRARCWIPEPVYFGQDMGKSNGSCFPLALKVFSLVSATLVLLSLLIAAVQSSRGDSGLGWSTLYLSGRGFDYYDYLPRFHHLHSAAFFTTTEYPNYPWYYPAPAIFVLYPFYAMPAHGYPSLIVTVLLMSLLLLGAFARRLGSAGLGNSSALLLCCVCFVSWPLYFGLQRGNIEALSWMILAAAIWAYSSERVLTAAVLIGVVGSVKIYPLLFLGIFFKKREYRAIAAGIASFAVVTLLGLVFLEPNILDSAQRTAAGIHRWTRDYGEVMHAAIDHSAFGLAKHFTFDHHPNYHRELLVYYLVAGSFTMAAYLRVMRLPVLNLVLFLSCAVVTLPPASFDYTLVALYVPLAWMCVATVRAEAEGSEIAGITAYFSLLAVVLSPESFLTQSVVPNLPGALKGACLLALMGMSLVYPLAPTATYAEGPANATA